MDDEFFNITQSLKEEKKEQTSQQLGFGNRDMQYELKGIVITIIWLVM